MLILMVTIERSNLKLRRNSLAISQARVNYRDFYLVVLVHLKGYLIGSIKSSQPCQEIANITGKWSANLGRDSAQARSQANLG